MALDVQFAHPYTDPDSGLTYSVGQLASLDDDLAKRLVFNGIVRLAGATPVVLVNPGVVDDVELSSALAAYEKKVDRGGANPGFVVALGADGQTLQLLPSSGGAGGGGAVFDASGTTKGLVALAGDLGGTAALPRVPGLAAKLDLEQVQDAVAAMIVAGSNVTAVYDDLAGKLTLSATGGSTAAPLDLEQVRDAVGLALRAGPGISVTVDDLADTITVGSTAMPVSTDPEVVRDVIGLALRAGPNITVTVDDVGDTITIAGAPAGGGGTLDLVDGGTATSTYADAVAQDEKIRDVVGATLVGGSGVTVTVDDLGDKITLTASGATDPEVVRDVIGLALRAGPGVLVAVDDLADTITISAGPPDPEFVRDTMGVALRAGAGVAIAVDDLADTITISATGTAAPGAVDAEGVRDTMALALVGGTNVTIVHNDPADTITVATTATINATDAQLRDRASHTGAQPTSSITGFDAAVSALVNAPGSAQNPHTAPTATRNAAFTVNFWSTWPAVPAGALAQDQLLVPAAGASGPSTVYLQQFDSTVAGWTSPDATATLSNSIERFSTSPASLKLVTAAAAVAPAQAKAASPKFPVTPGSTFTITARINSALAGRSVAAQAVTYDAGGVQVTSTFAGAVGGNTPAAGTSFSLLTWTVTVPSTATITQMELHLTLTQVAAAGEVFYVDDVTVG